ncbi:LtfC-like domain-containing protein [Promicromonospora sukumoe]
MTSTWRKQEPEVMPLVLYAGEDFTRILTFDGPGDIPPGSTITLKLFDGTGPDATELASWPAAISVAEAKWSVDYAVADAIPLETAGGYRLMMTVPNPGTPSNPTIERCLALGKLTRK